MDRALLRGVFQNAVDVQNGPRLGFPKWLLFRMVFRAWAAACPLRSDVGSRDKYEFYLGFRDRTFRAKLELLHCSLRDLVIGPSGRFIHEQLTHFNSLPFSVIKVLSYSGAVLRCDFAGTPRRWHWYDPGNHSYCVLWYLIRKTARHIALTSDVEQPRILWQAMLQCEQHWPREAARFNELVGDLLEASLALGYADQTLEHVILSLSSIAHWVTVFPQILGTNSGLRIRPTVLDPYQMADVILCARMGHHTGEWTAFMSVLCANEFRNPRWARASAQ